MLSSELSLESESESSLEDPAAAPPAGVASSSSSSELLEDLAAAPPTGVASSSSSSELLTAFGYCPTQYGSAILLISS